MCRILSFLVCIPMMLVFIGCQKSDPVSSSNANASEVLQPSLSGGVPPPEPWCFQYRRTGTYQAQDSNTLDIPITIDQWVNGISLGIYAVYTGESAVYVNSCRIVESSTDLIACNQNGNISTGSAVFSYRWAGTISTGSYTIRVVLDREISSITATYATIKACDTNPSGGWHFGADYGGSIEDYTSSNMGGDAGNILAVFGAPQQNQELNGQSHQRISNHHVSGSGAGAIYFNAFVDTCTTTQTFTLNSDWSTYGFRVNWIQFHPDPALLISGRE